MFRSFHTRVFMTLNAAHMFHTRILCDTEHHLLVTCCRHNSQTQKLFLKRPHKPHSSHHCSVSHNFIHSLWIIWFHFKTHVFYFKFCTDSLLLLLRWRKS
ncbi:hypothetical protein NL108_017575 [Boleophthalmus pectinirostris]|nr:hypothetical protein NL108_017575 [Boleophthalmus pectinirostris]